MLTFVMYRCWCVNSHVCIIWTSAARKLFYAMEIIHSEKLQKLLNLWRYGSIVLRETSEHFVYRKHQKYLKTSWILIRTCCIFRMKKQDEIAKGYVVNLLFEIYIVFSISSGFNFSVKIKFTVLLQQLFQRRRLFIFQTANIHFCLHPFQWIWSFINARQKRIHSIFNYLISYYLFFNCF